ncbi:hypothetical protein [Bacillus sp. Marseille-Q3570]|nr:hypothetical protein [Bacillus sp. Marseille-Q3570]
MKKLLEMVINRTRKQWYVTNDVQGDINIDKTGSMEVKYFDLDNLPED